MIRVVIERGKTLPFSRLPHRSVALDGYVLGPRIDASRERYSFDHHGGCVRHATRSTAEQVHDAIVLGFDPTDFTAFVNDIDLDTALAVWLLRHPDRVSEPLVNRLVRCAGLLDAFGGAYPIGGDLPRVIDWLAEPETETRADGRYYQMSADGLSELLEEVCHRVSVYVDGASLAYTREHREDTRYEILRKGTGWFLVRSVGRRVHAQLFHDGMDRVIIHTPLPDESHGYTVAKRSEFVKGFPVRKILRALAAVEPGWGGGSTIGGAPRNADGSRSRLSTDQVFDIVEAVVVPGVPAQKPSEQDGTLTP